MNETLDDALRFRIGRLYLDGASLEWLARRFSLSIENVADAWEFCRERLSIEVGGTSEGEDRLLSADELRSNAELCLRLILQWEHATVTRELLGQSTTSRPVDDGNHSE